MSIAFIFLSIILALGLVGAAVWLLRNNQKLQVQLQSAQQASHEAQTSEAIIRNQMDSELKSLRSQNESEKSAIRSQAEAEVSILRSALENEQKLLTEAKAQMVDSFKSLAATALEGNNRQFLELAKSVLSKETEVAKGDLEKRQQAIDSLLTPLHTTLSQYQSQAQQMERERQKSYANVETELRRVIETGVQLNAQTAALKDALKRPHVRGRWGEVQLKNCIELSGMSEFCDVSFQDSSETAEGAGLRPDMTVRMPGGRVVVVDAKTPLEAFLASLDSPTEELRTVEMVRHGSIVKDHVKKLSLRAYHDHLKESPDFTVMFLPNESFLYAALESQSDLVEFALQKKILIATPPTLIGLLKVIRYGWNEARMAQNAMKISEAGTELHKRLVDFVEAFDGMGRHLDKAREEFETGRKRLHSRVIVQARRMEVLGAKSSKDLPQSEDLIALSPAEESAQGGLSESASTLENLSAEPATDASSELN